jgi:hypothetical protein
MDRRIFLMSAPIALLASCMPAPALANIPKEPIEKHPLIINAEDFCEHFSIMGNRSRYEATMKVSKALVENYGDELFPNRELYATGTDGFVSKRLPTAYTYEIAAVAVPHTFRTEMEYQDAAQKFLIEFSGFLKDDYVALRKSLRASGYEMHPFLPVLAGDFSVNPQTFQPEIPFYAFYRPEPIRSPHG